MSNMLIQFKYCVRWVMITFIFLIACLAFTPIALAEISQVTVVNNCRHGQVFTFFGYNDSNIDDSRSWKYIPSHQRDTIQIRTEYDHFCGDSCFMCKVNPLFRPEHFKRIRRRLGAVAYFVTKDGQCVLDH